MTSEKLKLKNAQLRYAPLPQLVNILHGQVPDFDTFDVVFRDGQPGKALQYLDAGLVLNRVRKMCEEGQVQPQMIKDTLVGRAATLYTNPQAAPVVPRVRSLHMWSSCSRTFGPKEKMQPAAALIKLTFRNVTYILEICFLS